MSMKYTSNYISGYMLNDSDKHSYSVKKDIFNYIFVNMLNKSDKHSSSGKKRHL